MRCRRRAAADLVWVNGLADVTLEADLEPGWSCDLRFEVRLGALGHRWEQGPYATDASGGLIVPVALPGAAFLHDLAIDYVTDLAVRISCDDAGGVTVWQDFAPSMFLAWPTGRGTAPVVWDEATAAISAPRGVVSTALRATLDAGSTGRVLAPIPFAVPPSLAEDKAILPGD
jgi:hypothetical protein